jgi:hypothetical protein
MYCCRNDNNSSIALPNDEKAKICPDGEEPYKSPIIGDLLLCGQKSLNGSKCPKDFVCRPSPALEGIQVCCSAGG